MPRPNKASSEHGPECGGDGELRVGDLIPPGELDADLIVRWRALLAEHPCLDRPFFTPDYVSEVDEWVDGVRVAVLVRVLSLQLPLATSQTSPECSPKKMLEVCDWSGTKVRDPKLYKGIA